MMIKTEEKDFNRDMNSKALINNNVNALEEYKARVNSSQAIAKITNDFKELKNEFAEIKILLTQLLNK